MRIPDPSATIPDFGPPPDLSNAPNLAKLLGQGTPDDDPKSEPPKPPAPAPPKPPISKPAPAPAPVVVEESQSHTLLYVGIGLVVALLFGTLAFGATLLAGIGAVVFFG